MNEARRTEASMLHVDMDSFFVSVELLTRPELRGKPVVVAHDSPRSVISSASYEARRFGVRSAMPVSRAKQLCPALICIPPTRGIYREASREILRVFEEFTPLIEPLSIDEAFLDVAGSIKLFGPPVTIAERIRERVLSVTGLPASVGLAATKFVAKLASQRAKPDGILEVPPERTLDFLHPLPIDAMWGVGAATSAKLRARAIHTLGDLAREPLDSLSRAVGQAAAFKLHELANGRDPRAIETHRVEKSVGQEETYERDLISVQEVDRALLKLATGVGRRLRAQGFMARSIAVKVRWANFDTVSRVTTLPEPTQVSQRIFHVAQQLVDSIGEPGRPVRLLGVRGEQLVADNAVDYGLWDEDGKLRQLDHTLDEVTARLGGQVRPARLLD